MRNTLLLIAIIVATGISAKFGNLVVETDATIPSSTLTLTGLTNCDTIDTDANGVMTCGNDETGAGSGSAIIFDIGDDSGNDSTDLMEIATTGDTNSIFTEPTADKMLIAVGTNWPTSDTADALTNNPSDCSANQYATSIVSTGDLTCSQPGLTTLSDVNSATITAGRLLIADGVDFDSVAVQGDLTLGADGTMTVQANSVALGTDTTGNYAGSSSEGGAATTATALAANPSDCGANAFADAIAANGDLTCNAIVDADVPDTITIDLAATATALASNPSDCAANQYATTIAANGNLTCGSIVDADVPNDITIDLAATATALAANPTDCSTGEFATTIAASGNLTCAVAALNQFNKTIESPSDADNFLWMKASAAFTITDIECIVDPADSSESVVIDVRECNSTGDSCVTVDATITCDNDGASDDGSLSNGAIDSGDWIALDIGTVTGTVTQVSVSISY